MPTSDDVHVSVPRSVQRSINGAVVHRTQQLGPRDRFVVDTLPCTSPVRTVIDLAATLDGEQLEHVFEHARRHGLLTRLVFARRVDELAARGRPGSAAVRELLTRVEARPAESRLEVRAGRLLQRAGLRPEAMQHRVGGYRIDYAWVRRLVGLECDGFEWHGNRLAWKRDRRRLAVLEASGWRIVHWTWEDVTDRPAEALDRLRIALAAAPA